MANIKDIIAQSVNKVRQTAGNIFQDQSGFFQQGKFTPVKGIQQLTQLPLKQYQTPGANITRQFVQHRIIEPIKQIPTNLQTIRTEAPQIFAPQKTAMERLKSAGKTGLAGLSTIGALVPGIEDVGFAGYEAGKAALAGKTPEEVKKAFTGEQTIGLGEVAEKLKAPIKVQKTFEYGELPLLLAGGITSKKIGVKKAGELAEQVGKKIPIEVKQANESLQMTKPSFVENIIKEGKKEIGSIEPKKLPIKQQVRDTANNLYTQWVDRYNPITKLSESIKNKGIKIKTSEDPTYLVRRLTGAGGIADYRFNTELKPVIDQLDNLKIDKGDLDVYLKAKREAGFAEIGRKIKGINADIANKRIQAIESKYGQDIQNIAQQLYDYQNKGLQELIDSGFISKESGNLIRQQNPNYIPFDRVLDNLDDYLGLPTRKLMQGTQPIKKIVGSEKNIYSPLESIIANTFKQRAAIEKNNVAKSIVGLNNIDQNLGFVKSSKSGNDVISIWNNGKKEFWKVGSEIADTVKGLNEENSNLILRLLSAPASLLRQGATGRNPAFLIPNIIRDQLDAGVTSKYGYVPFIDFISGLRSMIKNDNIYQMWQNSGAKINLGEMSGRKSIRQYLDDKKVKKNLFTWIGKGLDIMGKYSEVPTRVGLFKKAYAKTKDPLEAMMESRDATLDFARMGSKMKVANSIIPFLNVGIQGFDKLIRAVKNNPGKVALNASIYGGLPQTLISAYNLSVHPQEYSEIPQYEKDSNFVIVKGRNEDGTVDYFTIPKGNILPLIANPIDNFMSFLSGNDNQSFQELATQLLGQTLPIIGEGQTGKEVALKTVGGLIPQAVKPAAENLLNKSFFKYSEKKGAKEIVPKYMQDREAYLQSYDWTPNTYKAIGSIFNVSPLKVQNLMEGYLAGYTKIPTQIIDMLVSVSKGEKIEQSDKPIFNRFLKQTTGVPQEEKVQEYKTPFMERVTGKVSAAETGGEISKIRLDNEKYKFKISNLSEKQLSDNIYFYKKDDESKTLDLNDINKMPDTTLVEKALKEKKKFTVVDDILENLSPDLQAQALSKLGISQKDAEYYNVARQTDDIKSVYVQEEIQNQINAGKSKDEIMQWLYGNRLEINNENILSTAVINDLVNNDIISYQDGKNLKAVETMKGKLQVKKAKGKKIKVTLRKVSPVKFQTKPIKLPKVKKIKLKVRKQKKFKAIKMQKLA